MSIYQKYLSTSMSINNKNDYNIFIKEKDFWRNNTNYTLFSSNNFPQYCSSNSNLKSKKYNSLGDLSIDNKNNNLEYTHLRRSIVELNEKLKEKDKIILTLKKKINSMSSRNNEKKTISTKSKGTDNFLNNNEELISYDKEIEKKKYFKNKYSYSFHNSSNNLINKYPFIDNVNENKNSFVKNNDNTKYHSSIFKNNDCKILINPKLTQENISLKKPFTLTYYRYRDEIMKNPKKNNVKKSRFNLFHNFNDENNEYNTKYKSATKCKKDFYDINNIKSNINNNKNNHNYIHNHNNSNSNNNNKQNHNYNHNHNNRSLSKTKIENSSFSNSNLNKAKKNVKFQDQVFDINQNTIQNYKTSIINKSHNHKNVKSPKEKFIKQNEEEKKKDNKINDKLKEQKPNKNKNKIKLNQPKRLIKGKMTYKQLQEIKNKTIHNLEYSNEKRVHFKRIISNNNNNHNNLETIDNKENKIINNTNLKKYINKNPIQINENKINKINLDNKIIKKLNNIIKRNENNLINENNTNKNINITNNSKTQEEIFNSIEEKNLLELKNMLQNGFNCISTINENNEYENKNNNDEENELQEYNEPNSLFERIGIRKSSVESGINLSNCLCNYEQFYSRQKKKIERNDTELSSPEFVEKKKISRREERLPSTFKNEALILEKTMSDVEILIDDFEK